MTAASQILDRVLVLEMVRVTEAAAIAAAKLIGRGDEKAADAAAVEAMTATRQPLLAGRSSPAATALAGLWADVERRLTA